jgi:hypothetical protein
VSGFAISARTSFRLVAAPGAAGPSADQHGILCRSVETSVERTIAAEYRANVRRWRLTLARSKEILRPSAYRNYRNVRAVAVLFNFLGGAFTRGVVAGIVQTLLGGGVKIGPFEAAFACVGAVGLIGGIASLRGCRRWAPMIYRDGRALLVRIPRWVAWVAPGYNSKNRELDHRTSRPSIGTTSNVDGVIGFVRRPVIPK